MNSPQMLDGGILEYACAFLSKGNERTMLSIRFLRCNSMDRLGNGRKHLAKHHFFSLFPKNSQPQKMQRYPNYQLHCVSLSQSFVDAFRSHYACRLSRWE